jgi:hypothetical protein
MQQVIFKFKLGSKVCDNISGLIGILDAAALKKSGSRQYSIQPKSLLGEIKPDGWFVDEDQLTLLDEEFAKEGTQEVNFEYSLGDKVQDKVSGIKGTIMYTLYWINGCKHYSIQPRAKKNASKRPESIVIDEGDLKLIAAGTKIKDEHPKISTPGGPSVKSNSLKC